MMVKEPKKPGKSPCMIIFCEYEQQFMFIELGKKYGLMKYIPLVFRKNFSAQVLKANMKIVGNCEYGLLLYRDKLPKFNNDGRMIFNCFDWVRDDDNLTDWYIVLGNCIKYIGYEYSDEGVINLSEE